MPADAKSQRVVELCGEVGRIVDQTVLKTFKTSDYMELLKQAGGVDTGILPFGCIYLKEGKLGKHSSNPGAAFRLYVCLERPKIRSIRFEGYDSDEPDDKFELRTFALAMPWVVTFISFINEGLARVVMNGIMSPGGVDSRGLNTELYHLPLPNIENEDGTFCLGDLRLDSSQPHWRRANDTLRYIDDSVWNNDLWPVWGRRVDEGESTPNVLGFKDWEEKTKNRGQGFWRELRLLRTGGTLQSKMGELTA